MSARKKSPTTFGDTAQRLVDNGYDPLPICRAHGKRPPKDFTWRNPPYKFRGADAQQYADYGTGIVCGDVVGADIDVRDERLAAQIEAMAVETLGAAPRRIGAAPKVLLMYRTAKRFEKIHGQRWVLPSDDPSAPGYKPHKVEILAEGQQFVAYGIHRDTHRPYRWNGVGDPLTVPLADLPVITEAQARGFVEAADAILAKVGKPFSKSITAGFGDTKKRPKLRSQLIAPLSDLISALAAIPNDLDYDQWIKVGLAFHEGCGKHANADEAREAWVAWSLNWPNNTRAIALKKWKSFKSNPNRPASQRAGAATVFAMAKEAGWTPPWPDPVNLLGDMIAPAFTGDEVPFVLSEYAVAYARSTGFDPSLTISAVVSVAAAALTDDFQIVGDATSEWFQQPRLWILAIGRPGVGKTPVQKAMLAPLWAIQMALLARHEASAPDNDEDAVPVPRVIVSDTTIEALSERLRDNPRGLLVANDEFESWLGSHDMYRAGAVSRDKGEWLKLFDGGRHTVERIKRGSMIILNWGASILTATTPAALAKLTRALPEDGLIQRFIPIIARRKVEPEPVTGLHLMRTRYETTIKRLYEAIPDRNAGHVALSAEAVQFLKTWEARSQLTQEAFGALESALESHLSKYPTFLLRLALTFHAAECVNHKEDIGAVKVSVKTMETAARFLDRARMHAVALYLDRRSGNDVYELTRDVARAILARGWTQVARRELIQTVRSFRGAREDAQDAALRLFVDLGWLRYAEGGYKTTTPARFDVNPHLKTKFAEVAERERERRAIVREVIAQSVQGAKYDAE